MHCKILQEVTSLCPANGRPIARVTTGRTLGIYDEYIKLFIAIFYFVAGASTLISAFLILALPDLTKEKMPQTVSEIEAYQFSVKTSHPNEQNKLTCR